MRTRTYAMSRAASAAGAILAMIGSAPLPRWHAATQDSRHEAAEPGADGAACGSLACYMRESYLDLLKISPNLQFSPAEIEQEQKQIAESEKACEAELRPHQSDQPSSNSKSPQSAEGASGADPNCALANVQSLAKRSGALATELVPVAYANLETKLGILSKWAADRQALRDSLNSGSYTTRHWGDVLDIGFRDVAQGRQPDVELGRDIVHQLRDAHIFPAALDDDKVNYYVRSVAMRVAAHSDLRAPLHVAVLDSDEANAFCFPGGYLFIERGLLQQVDDEAELAGVIGHEIAHAATRHGEALLHGESISAVVQETSKQVAGSFSDPPGPAAGGAFRHGSFGLASVISLKLLGVTPENEMQADQLGIQYAWSAGYDPSGFLRFFDKMAQAGYGPGLSWLRTHPPSYERIANAERETQYLPEKSKAMKQTSSFEDMQNELMQWASKSKNNANSD